MNLKPKIIDFYFIKNILKQNFFKWKVYFLGEKEKFETYEIEDSYNWRGLMIDTARHMPSVDYLKKTISKISELGLNRLHLHLSDDQGFRVESKKYPKLNEIGSFRNETAIDKLFPTPWNPLLKFAGDGKRYGGFYKQDELKDLVKFAREKGVEIIPEIDIPGHATAMIASYPELSANSNIKIKSPATYWGVFENVLSDKKETIIFLKNLFDEIIEIFSPKYVHIGGDEVPLKNYKGDENIPKTILGNIARYLKEKGVEVIMWNEASDIALATDSVIMAWQSVESGVNHLKKGGKVIFSPCSHFYFDYYQKAEKGEPLAIGGYLPLHAVYNFRLSKDLREKYGENILGLQANMWTEYMSTEEQMNYMLYPRLYAFAEVAKGTNVDFKDFKKRFNLI